MNALSFKKVIVLGASVGGNVAFETIFSHLPKDFPAIVLAVQHISQGCTKAFAERLSVHSKLPVKEIENNEVVRPGIIYVGRSGFHFTLKKNEDDAQIKIEQTPRLKNQVLCPTIDEIMISAAKNFGALTMGVILTGRGHDGREGMKAIHNAGGTTIVQDKASCEAYDMPKACLDAGIVDHEIPLNQIASYLIESVCEK